jgi:hypothetical protein
VVVSVEHRKRQISHQSVVAPVTADGHPYFSRKII